MSASFKLGSGVDGSQRFEYPNIWSRERTTGPERLVIAPSGGHVSLMIELGRSMAVPLGFLYVLTVSRGQAEEARYQSEVPVGGIEAHIFLTRFARFLESDGRHSLWLKSTSTEDLLVYDKHNVLYAYGDLPKFEKILTDCGMQKTDQVQFPSPHTHFYHSEFDEEEQELMRYWEWRQFPLQNTDDL